MTPHYSGTTLDAQARYADGTKKMLDAWFKGEAFEDSWYIVREGGPLLSRLQMAMWLSPAALFVTGLCSPVQVSWPRSTSEPTSAGWNGTQTLPGKLNPDHVGWHTPPTASRPLIADFTASVT